MRSGLQKPGAVPFLALVIFCLLSLVPSLAKEWGFYSIRLGYLCLPRYEGRYFSSRFKNASIDTKSRLLGTSSHCKPWLLGDSCSPFIDRKSPSHQSVINTPPRSSFEAAAEPGNDPIAYFPIKEPSSLTRGVSAFKEFVIKRWDDQQTAQPLPAGHGSVLDTFSTNPTPTLVNLSATLTLSHDELHYSTPLDDFAGTPLTKPTAEISLLFRLPLYLHETWQQVCHSGGYYLESLIPQIPPHHHNKPLISNSTATAFVSGERTSSQHSPTEEHPSPERASTKRPPSNDGDSAQPDTPLEPRHPLPTPKSSSNSLVTTAGQCADTGIRQDSKHMRGSSMAIVIGLVVGIMWF